MMCTEAIDLKMPGIRDHDNQLYIREWSGGILAGCFELNGMLCFEDTIPKPFEFQLLPFNWDHCRKSTVRLCEYTSCSDL